MTQSESWAVIGGGMLGLTLAYRLAQQGRRVTLFESADRLGGLASAWQVGDVTWDRHYHVTLLSDLRLRSLLTELDLERDMQWVETKTGCYADGNLYSVSNTIEFLQLPVLGLLEKLRLGGTIFYGSKIPNGKRLEKITVEDWLVRWSGRRAFEQFWLPLLKSKLGENYRKCSAAFIWSTIARLYAARRTGLKKEMFGYYPGGYARILERFADVLNQQSVEIRLGSRVDRVTREGGRIEVRLDSDEAMAFDKVAVTLAAPLAARVCADITDAEKAALTAIRYQGIVCASCLLSRPLGGYYVTNIIDDWVPFTGVIEMSALVDKKHFGGSSLVYLPRYLDPDDAFFDHSDDDVQALFFEALQRMYPELEPEDLLAFRVSRVRQVLALSTLTYSDSLPPRSTSVEGLYLVNSAHIVNGTLNVNETIQLAEDALGELLD